jgi:hypothetical protein
MHPHAPNPAAQPHLSLNAFSVVSQSREERNGSGERPCFPGTLASRDELLFGRTFAAEKREGDFGPVGVCRSVSRPLLGVTLRGLSGALRLGALLLRLHHPITQRTRVRDPGLRRPLGYGFQLRRTLRKCRAWHLGAGPLARLRQV